MSKVYRTVKGKTIDIDKIKLSNESAIAVSNMRVNARGDALGPGGSVSAGRNQLMDQVYMVETAPEPPYSPTSPDTIAEMQAIQDASRAKKLHDLANGLVPTNALKEPLVDDIEPAARGALASAVAKTVTVNQGPAPTPQEQRRAQGPKRI